MSGRVWSLISLGDDRQYGGNTGYDDDVRSVYRYDSAVANCKRVAAGDLVLLRDKERLKGIALIEEIRSYPSVKVRQRCPQCHSPNLKTRQHQLPRWRCEKGHVFDSPLEDRADVTAYEAHYPHTFLDLPDIVPVSEIKRAALRPSDQLSMQELDFDAIEKLLLDGHPETKPILEQYIQRTGLGPDAAAVSPEPGVSEAGDSHYKPSGADTRQSILRSIRARRGQQKFRKDLIRRYGAQCMISGCRLVDIIEAAHIWPYRGEADHHSDNGLLLRADLHTLFDLNLLAIEPETLTVKLSKKALDAGYQEFEGATLKLSAKRAPARDTLKQRWLAFSAQK